MFKRLFFTLLLCLLAQPVLAEPTSRRSDPTVEPPMVYTLTVGDQKVALIEGQPVRVEGQFTNPMVQLSVEPCRVFLQDGVAFHYPDFFTHEADVNDTEAMTWTLSGNDVTLMWFDLVGDVSAAGMAEAMIGQFGRENCHLAAGDARLLLSGKPHVGVSLKVQLAGERLSIDLYRVSDQEGRSKLLVLQDVLDDMGRPSRECTKLREILMSSFQIAP
jgi:hypothetical protein